MEVKNGKIIGSRAARFLDYVDAIGAGEFVSRLDMAQKMGCCRSTATYNLERAWTEGYLNKVYGYASTDQPGWIYALKETMPTLDDELSNG